MSTLCSSIDCLRDERPGVLLKLPSIVEECIPQGASQTVGWISAGAEKGKNDWMIYDVRVPMRYRKRGMGTVRFDLAGFAEPFSGDDGSLLSGDIGSGGVLIPLFDQQPCLLP
jgi:hypothetical protein